MNTQELAALLAAVPLDSNGQPLRVVCVDDSSPSDFTLRVMKIDANNALVHKHRIEHAARQAHPLDRAEYEAVYFDPQQHDFWLASYPTFDAFYNFMEQSRLDEQALIDNAVEAAVLLPSWMSL